MQYKKINTIFIFFLILVPLVSAQGTAQILDTLFGTTTSGGIFVKIGLFIVLFAFLMLGTLKLFPLHKNAAIIVALIISLIGMKFMPAPWVQALGTMVWILAIIMLPYAIVTMFVKEKGLVRNILLAVAYAIVLYSVYSLNKLPGLKVSTGIGYETFEDFRYYLYKLSDQWWIPLTIIIGLFLIHLIFKRARKGAETPPPEIEPAPKRGWFKKIFSGIGKGISYSAKGIGKGIAYSARGVGKGIGYSAKGIANKTKGLAAWSKEKLRRLKEARALRKQKKADKRVIQNLGKGLMDAAWAHDIKEAERIGREFREQVESKLNQKEIDLAWKKEKLAREAALARARAKLKEYEQDQQIEKNEEIIEKKEQMAAMRAKRQQELEQQKAEQEEEMWAEHEKEEARKRALAAKQLKERTEQEIAEHEKEVEEQRKRELEEKLALQRRLKKEREEELKRRMEEAERKYREKVEKQMEIARRKQARLEEKQRKMREKHEREKEILRRERARKAAQARWSKQKS